MILSIASGKGGTGKTLVATSLAVSLRDIERVQVLDLDVEEPNDHIFLKPTLSLTESATVLVPHLDKDKCNYCGICSNVCHYNAIAVGSELMLMFPELCHSCGACIYHCPNEALTEKKREIGSIVTGNANGISLIQGRLSVGDILGVPIIKQVKERSAANGLVIIDASPGTSCPVIEAVRDSDFCILVTEPTPFGLNDLTLAVGMCRELEVPCGVVLNRAGTGDRLITDYCTKEQIPILLTIPLDRQIAALYSLGITLAEALPGWQTEFIKLYERVKGMVDERATCYIGQGRHRQN